MTGMKSSLFSPIIIGIICFSSSSLWYLDDVRWLSLWLRGIFCHTKRAKRRAEQILYGQWLGNWSAWGWATPRSCCSSTQTIAHWLYLWFTHTRTLSQALTPLRPHTHSGNKAATVVVFQHKYIILSAAGCLFVMLRISAAIFSSPLLAFSPLFPIFPAFPGPTVPSSISRHCVRIKRNG